MSTIPILCINLKRASERRSFIEKEWVEKRGCDITFIEAFDRREIENGKGMFEFDENNSLTKARRKLVSGEVGCITSHILALQYAIDNNMEEVIIIEDDAVPLFGRVEEFYKSVSHIDNEYPQAEIAMLHHWQGDRRYIFKETNANYSLVKKPSWGNCAVYFKKSVYDRFINDLKTFSTFADGYWSDYANENILVAPNNPLIRHQGDSSYIGPRASGVERFYIQ